MIHINVRRPMTLRGYSGFYSTTCHADLKQEVSTTGTPPERFAFREKVGTIIAFMDALQEIDCEATILCIVGPTQNTFTGNIEVWSESLAPIARDAICGIRRACEELASLGGQSTGQLSLSLSRSVAKKAA